MKFQNVVSLTYLIKKKPTNLKNNKPLIFQAIRPRYRRHFEDLGAILSALQGICGKRTRINLPHRKMEAEEPRLQYHCGGNRSKNKISGFN